jgi:hypothetical protein
MKKFLVVLVVVAMTCMSSMAFAADVSVNGSIEYLMRSFVNLDLNDTSGTISDNRSTTQERVRLNIDAKAGDVLSGRIGIENDWDTWGRFESVQANGAETTVVTDPTGTTINPGAKTTHGTQLGLREAWIGFRLPGTPVGIKGGHMLLQLGNGWFFRSMKYGSDAWVAYTDIDALHLGFVDIKVAENTTTLADDTDAYAFVVTYKLSDSMSAGINFTNVNDRAGKTFTALYGLAPLTIVNANLQNAEAHFTGKVGPVKLNAEIDVQMGDATDNTQTKSKFKGNQVVLQANVAMDPLTINATLARGSGVSATDTSGDFKEYVALMDADVHYTLVYEYLVKTAAQQSFKTTGTGFGNTTAISLGAAFNASKNLMIGADVWMLQATQEVSLNGGALSDKLGTEIDAKINWKMYENLTWNTTIGYFMPGDAYKFPTRDADTARAIQSVLSFKF